MTIGTPNLIDAGGSATDGTSYGTGPISALTAEAFIGLFVSNGAAVAGQNTVPTVQSPGLIWRQILTNNNIADGIRGTWFWAPSGSSPPGSGWEVDIAGFAATQSSCQWSIFEVTGVDLLNPIVQAVTTQPGTNLDDPTITLDTLQAGSIPMGAHIVNATTVLPPGAGPYTALTPPPGASGPAVVHSIEYFMDDAWSEVGWTTTLNLEKALYAIELRANPAAATGALLLEDGTTLLDESGGALLTES